MVLPLFKSHYSIGRSILTLDEESLEDGPDSIVEIAKEYALSEVFLIEDNMGGFLQAYQNLDKAGVKLIYGLRLTICPDIEDKNEESPIEMNRGESTITPLYADPERRRIAANGSYTDTWDDPQFWFVSHKQAIDDEFFCPK